jgi:ATP-dependent Lon protease
MKSPASGSSVEEQVRIPDELPVLPLRDMVVYPFIIAPLSVARDVSIQAVDRALAENRMILLAAQRDKDEDEPEASAPSPSSCACSSSPTVGSGCSCRG